MNKWSLNIIIIMSGFTKNVTHLIVNKTGFKDQNYKTLKNLRISKHTQNLNIKLNFSDF